jgi:hypothetical protein
MANRVSLFIAGLSISLLAAPALAADGCLLSVDELSAAAGRAFSAGEPRKDIVTEEPQCFYAQKDKPKRGMTLRIHTQKAASRFEATKRVTTFGSDPVELSGVGDAAFFNGTSAGVLVGDKAVILGSIRGAGDPKIAREKVVGLLKLVAARLK